MILLNGRGLLGEQLKKDIVQKKAKDNSVSIYHTWQSVDKREETQKLEFNKFKKYLKSSNETKVFFISSVVQTQTWYTHYKHMSEAYLIQNNDGAVIRIPQLAADNSFRKGTFYKLKRGAFKPYGEMLLSTLEEASDQIIEIISEHSKSNLCRSFTTKGRLVDAKLVTDLMKIS